MVWSRDLWLDCLSEREIEAETGIADRRVHYWVGEKRKSAEFGQPPASR
jgi:hypothetical protein